MYMSLPGKPTDQDSENCPHMLLSSTHEWDPSVLDMHIKITMDIPTAHLIPQ